MPYGRLPTSEPRWRGSDRHIRPIGRGSRAVIRALLVGDGKKDGCGALEALVRRVIAEEITCGFEKVNRLRDYDGQTPKFVKKTACGSRLWVLARKILPLIVWAEFI